MNRLVCFFLWSDCHYYIPGSVYGGLLRYNVLFFPQAVYYALNLVILVFYIVSL